MLVAERLRQAVISLPVMVEGIGPVPVTVSFGVATSQDGAEPEHAVIERADQALYLAKEGGRNRVVLAERPSPAPPLNRPLPPVALKLVIGE